MNKTEALKKLASWDYAFISLPVRGGDFQAERG
jgi:hypothetical protein